VEVHISTQSYDQLDRISSFAVADRWIRELLGEKPLTNPEYLQLFVVLVLLSELAIGGSVRISPAIAKL
jgi:hypothetical protein